MVINKLKIYLKRILLIEKKFKNKGIYLRKNRVYYSNNGSYKIKTVKHFPQQNFWNFELELFIHNKSTFVYYDNGFKGQTIVAEKPSEHM